MRLYSGPFSMFGMKAEIAVREKGLEVETILVPFTLTHYYEPKHPEVLRVNPKAQVPVLIDGPVEIFDSTQIFEYLEDLKPTPPLWPRDRIARAEARLLEHKSDEVFFPPVIRLMGLYNTPDDPAAVAARAQCVAYYDAEENRIGSRPFLAGDYSYADIAFYMAQLYAHRMGAPMVAGHTRLRAWRERVSDRPAVEPIMRRFVGFLSEHKRPIPDFLERFA